MNEINGMARDVFYAEGNVTVHYHLGREKTVPDKQNYEILISDIKELRNEMLELKTIILKLVSSATALSGAEEADIIRHVVSVGTRKAMRDSAKLVNGE